MDLEYHLAAAGKQIELEAIIDTDQTEEDILDYF